MPNPENGQTHSNNSSAIAEELFEYVWRFCEAGKGGFQSRNGDTMQCIFYHCIKVYLCISKAAEKKYNHGAATGSVLMSQNSQENTCFGVSSLIKLQTSS